MQVVARDVTGVLSQNFGISSTDILDNDGREQLGSAGRCCNSAVLASRDEAIIDQSLFNQPYGVDCRRPLYPKRSPCERPRGRSARDRSALVGRYFLPLFGHMHAHKQPGNQTHALPVMWESVSWIGLAHLPLASGFTALTTVSVLHKNAVRRLGFLHQCRRLPSHSARRPVRRITLQQKVIRTRSV